MMPKLQAVEAKGLPELREIKKMELERILLFAKKRTSGSFFEAISFRKQRLSYMLISSKHKNKS